MKTFISMLALVVLFGGLWWWGEKNNMGNAPVTSEGSEFGEFCYIKLKDSPNSEFEDKYSLKFGLKNGNASGELRLLPAEKDALIGKFTGTVSGGGMPPHTLHAWGSTVGEGMTATHELNIIFDQQEAKIGFGALKVGDDGKYTYEDPAKIDYSFDLSDISCADLNEREAVEKYLWENIAKLSPIAPALGGNWYVVAAELDLEKNTGEVTYEDGHIQEKRNFSYVLDADGAMESMSIE